MIVSINPSYFCNFRCDFCYLTKEQLGDQKRISIEKMAHDLLDNAPPEDFHWCRHEIEKRIEESK